MKGDLEDKGIRRALKEGGQHLFPEGRTEGRTANLDRPFFLLTVWAYGALWSLSAITGLQHFFYMDILCTFIFMNSSIMKMIFSLNTNLI